MLGYKQQVSIILSPARSNLFVFVYFLKQNWAFFRIERCGIRIQKNDCETRVKILDVKTVNLDAL